MDTLFCNGAMGDIERKLDYFEPSTRAEKIVAVCPTEELVENEKSWKKTLVGYTIYWETPVFRISQ
jgi:hypothetical protein